ncbi:hypothetical protein ACIO13_35775 [Streptomyces sp. NPDC087425]|uniref:hypothetical protein n=1 Tax=Streptomyces sp. NPDC087425 TaxID=3365787 RepID=UPI00382F2794
MTTPARPKAVAPITPAEKTAARDAARADSDTIIRRYQAREPVSRIAADYHVTPNWLALRLIEWGVPRRHRHEAHALRRPAGHVFRGRTRRRSTAEVRAAQAQFTGDRADVTARYLAGTSITTLAREYQVNPVWVTERLDDWNVPRRKQSAAAAAARARSAR